MRSRVAPTIALFVLSACSVVGGGGYGPRSPASDAEAGGAASEGAPARARSDVADERAANLAAYRFVYLPAQQRLVEEHRGRWLAIAGGRVVPARGAEPAPAASLELADAAARAAAPGAKHRFVFEVGEEGDAEWPLGGCELPHVLGTRFLALLERDDVLLELSAKDPSIAWVEGDRVTELAALGDGNRTFLQPSVGPPGQDGTAAASYCLSTGFGGFVTMPPSSAAGLEMWEIPGKVRVEGALQSGDCRRARARLHWANTPLDFTVPVAIWPK